MTRRAAARAVITALVLVAGCRFHALPREAPKRNNVPLNGSVAGRGWRLRWRTTGADGRLNVPAMTASADGGTLLRVEPGQASAELFGVRATIYHDGKPAGRLRAPEVTADEPARRVVATHRPAMDALKGGGTLTADQIVWKLDAQAIIATGNAVARFRLGNGTPAELRDNRITYVIATGEFRAG